MGAVPRWTESVNGITLADVKHIVVLCLFVAVAAMVLALSADGPGVASAASSSSVPSTCSADHLSTTGSWEGATNSNLGAVSFTDTGTKACSLKGYLPLTLRTQSGKTLPVAIRPRGDHAAPEACSPSEGSCPGPWRATRRRCPVPVVELVRSQSWAAQCPRRTYRSTIPDCGATEWRLSRCAARMHRRSSNAFMVGTSSSGPSLRLNRWRSVRMPPLANREGDTVPPAPWEYPARNVLSTQKYAFSFELRLSLPSGSGPRADLVVVEIEAIEDFVEVVAVEPVSLASNLVQYGARYFIGLIDTVLNHNVTIGLAVPHVHGDRDFVEQEPPWSQFESKVLDPARPAVDEGCARSSRSAARISGRSITATSQVGRVRLIHASALSGEREAWRNPAPRSAPISRGAIRAPRCAMRFDCNISCFEILAWGGAGPLTMAQPTSRSPRNLAHPAAFGPPLE